MKCLCCCFCLQINKFIWLTLVILVYLLCWYKHQLEAFFLLFVCLFSLDGLVWGTCSHKLTRIILGMDSANERRRYIVTSSLIACVHTKNDPWLAMAFHLFFWPINLVSFQAYHEAFDMLFIPTTRVIYVIVCFLFSCVAVRETWSGACVTAVRLSCSQHVAWFRLILLIFWAPSQYKDRLSQVWGFPC